MEPEGVIISFPNEIMVLIAQYFPWNRRTLIFSLNRALYDLHVKNCLSLTLPSVKITKNSRRSVSDYSYPITDLSFVHPQGYKRRDFPQYHLVVRQHIDPVFNKRWRTAKHKSLFLPADPNQKATLSWMDHTQFCATEVTLGLAGSNAYGSKCLFRLLDERNRPVEAIFVGRVEKHYYCWDGRAPVHLHGGGTKPAGLVRVGDVLLGASGGPTVVRRVKETVIGGEYGVVDMGDFYITRGHPVLHCGDWYRPDELFPVTTALVDTLYNFYAEPEHFLVVGAAPWVCSSLGGYCPRLAEMDPFTDVLYGRGYGSKEAEHYKWLLALTKRIPDNEVFPRVPDSYEDLYPGREDIVILGRSPVEKEKEIVN